MQHGTPGVFRPLVTHVLTQTVKKGEDVVVAHHTPYNNGVKGAYNLAIFAVADGHNGDAAAQHIQSMLCSEIRRHLPSSPPPIAPGTDATKKYAEQLREALATTFLTLEAQFVLTGQLSGCTLTVALVTDWLLTVAAVGDSKAVLDTGAQFMDLTPEHRVQHHLAEQSRLKAAGTYLAPISVYMDGAAEPDEPGYGPLRAWPGGLCVSRAIGDVDVGESIIAHPHIMQVQIPQEGARLIMASDGLWDCFTSRKAVKMLRTKENHHAGEHISRAAIRRQNGQVNDDLSIVIIDMLPANTTFPDVVGTLTRSNSNCSLSPKPIKRPSSLKSFFGCASEPTVLEEFDASFHDPSIRDPSTRGKTGDHSTHCNVNIIADMDSYVEYSHLSPMSVSIKRQLWPAQAQTQTHSQSPFQQAVQESPSSDSSGSTTFAPETVSMITDPPSHPTAAGGVGPGGRRSSIDRHSIDRGRAPMSPLYRSSLDQINRTTDLTRTFSRGSLDFEGQTHVAQASQAAPLERRSSIGDKLARTLSRGSLGGRRNSQNLEHVSLTHFGGPPQLVPVRGDEPPEKMIVDPTTHAASSFRKRSTPDLESVYRTM